MWGCVFVSEGFSLAVSCLSSRCTRSTCRSGIYIADIPRQYSIQPDKPDMRQHLTTSWLEHDYLIYMKAQYTMYSVIWSSYGMKSSKCSNMQSNVINTYIWLHVLQLYFIIIVIKIIWLQYYYIKKKISDHKNFNQLQQVEMRLRHVYASKTKTCLWSVNANHCMSII